MELGENLEALEYLLQHIEYYVSRFMDDVMEDSEEDPEYSAVTLNNLILCVIRLQKMLDDTYPIQTVREYFLETHFYTEKDFERFEENRKKESLYYIGKQFLQP